MLTIRLIPIICSVIIVMAVFFPATSVGDIAIIVHPSNNNKISLAAIKKIFLSKSYTFPNGGKVEAFQPASKNLREMFNKKVLVRSESALRSYWARMLFSSRAKPPVMLDDVESIKNMVGKNQQAISYINKKDVDNTVKVVLVIQASSKNE